MRRSPASSPTGSPTRRSWKFRARFRAPNFQDLATVEGAVTGLDGPSTRSDRAEHDKVSAQRRNEPIPGWRSREPLVFTPRPTVEATMKATGIGRALVLLGA